MVLTSDAQALEVWADLARARPLVVVPSGKTKTLAHGRAEVALATIASPAARLLASLRRSTKIVWVMRETEETKGVLESSILATTEPLQRKTTRVSRKEV